MRGRGAKSFHVGTKRLEYANRLTTTELSTKALVKSDGPKNATNSSTDSPGPRLNMQLEYRILPNFSVLQEKAFSECDLPLTMKIAEHSKKLLIPKLHQFPREWPFQDRVLVWIASTFREDVAKFHSRNGPCMAAIFEEHQIQHLDEDLSKRLCGLLRKLPK